MRKIVIPVMLMLASCGSSIEEASRKLTLQEQLAVLDGNTRPDTTDIKVIRIKTLLADLSESYGEPVDTIAEWTSKAQGVLHDKGIQESNLNILEEMNKAGKIENTPYRDAITLYALMRAKGY